MAQYTVNVKSKRDKSEAAVICEAPSFKDAVEKVSNGLHSHLEVVKTGQAVKSVRSKGKRK